MPLIESESWNRRPNPRRVASGAARSGTSGGRANRRGPHCHDRTSWHASFWARPPKRLRPWSSVSCPAPISGQTESCGAVGLRDRPAASVTDPRRPSMTSSPPPRRRDPSRTSASTPRSRSRLRASSSRAVRSPLSICSCTRRSSIDRFSRSSLAVLFFNCSFSYSRWLKLVLSWPTEGPPVKKLD